MCIRDRFRAWEKSGKYERRFQRGDGADDRTSTDVCSFAGGSSFVRRLSLLEKSVGRNLPNSDFASAGHSAASGKKIDVYKRQD